MAEILGLGVTHYPPLAWPDAAMARIVDRVVQSPRTPPALREPAGWPAPMRQEWEANADFSGVAADRARYQELRDGNRARWSDLRTADIEASGQQELLNWVCLAGAMTELGQKPLWSAFVETYIFNSSKCFAAFGAA